MTTGRTGTPGPAARHWAESLGRWAIPEDILERAPESPWTFPLGPFVRSSELILAGEAPDTPSRRRALEALEPGGVVLDVGAGAGAGAFGLVPPARRVVGVDRSAEMLRAFGELAERVGVSHREVVGSWPEVADDVEVADVVVCHDVFYNVGELGPFCAALTGHARRRVVVQLTATHPMAWLNPLWRRFHGIERPEEPLAEDAVAVLEELGLVVGVERWMGPSRFEGVARADHVAFVRRRLCLPAEADPEIDQAMAPAHGTPREAVCLWWPGAG